MNITTQPDTLLSYWHCHNYIPQSVLIASTVINGLLCMFIVNAAFGIAFYFAHNDLKRVFNTMERRAIVLQYLFAMPLFELFVVWGPQLQLGINHNSSSSVITWLTVNTLSLGLVLGSLCATHRYRMLIHVAQCMRMPLAVMYFCDRAINFTVGVEGVFIGFVFICAAFEMVHVHQYFTKYMHQRMPRRAMFYQRPEVVTASVVATAHTEPTKPTDGTPRTRAGRRSRRSRVVNKVAIKAAEQQTMSSASASSDDEEKKVHSAEEESVHTDFHTQRKRQEQGFDSDVPLTVREDINKTRRHQQIVQVFGELARANSSGTVGRIASQLQQEIRAANDDAGETVVLGSARAPSANMSVSDEKRSSTNNGEDSAISDF